jgi:hypothetical protein
MDLILALLGLILVILGIVGSVLPVLPGPVTGWFGLMLLAWSEAVPANYYLLGVTLVVSLMILVLDYLIPGMGAKRFGGTRMGSTGATLGLLIGLILPVPLGFVIGAFAGALIGELFADPKDLKKAMKSAFGSFMGFLASTTMKLLTSIVFLAIYLFQIYRYSGSIFSL